MKNMAFKKFQVNQQLKKSCKFEEPADLAFLLTNVQSLC